MASWRDDLNERELREVEWALEYSESKNTDGTYRFRHGAAGHNALLVMAKMAIKLDAPKWQTGTKRLFEVYRKMNPVDDEHTAPPAELVDSMQIDDTECAIFMAHVISQAENLNFEGVYRQISHETLGSMAGGPLLSRFVYSPIESEMFNTWMWIGVFR